MILKGWRFKMEKKIEIAKSFFVLSQIFIILAGFIFASASVYYRINIDSEMSMIKNANEVIPNLLNSEEEKVWEIILSIYSNAEEAYKGTSLKHDKIRKKLIFLGLFLTILSILFWYIGYKKLKNITFQKHVS